ncbi:branched-chain amino acid ABC transporter substrate-binding protein [Knoellia sinensis KCTC 19936]|uniref:Branched-chain amino acid ABC transporter substrate-binding protein n=1 Tax=Knoellia sinensis KCTC 19936 TaxID=1385520 RepID=A0A0A0J3R7_9MICO|nr:ABC transporter substrate-binding protein [Knoellia sinensis]KGN30772.1 branched-chain amino acid ABC transporter substrate-binding protein [Knoellia sinensis KCTC 19936]
MTHRHRLGLSACAVALGLTLSACGGATEGGSDVGVEDGAKEAIKVGILADLSGDTGDVGTPYNEGMLGYIDALNAKGGIDGHKIEAMSNDYAYKLPEAESLYTQYVKDGAVAIQGWGTADSEALRARVAADELPFMSASYAEALTDPKVSPYNFVVAATYSDQMRVALDWIAKDSANQGQVAVFHNDSPFGTAPVADGEKWIDEKSLGLGYTAYPMPKEPNQVGLLTQAKTQGARYIVIQDVSSQAAQVAKDIKALGFDMKVVCLNWCADELFIKSAGAENAEGTIFVQPFAFPSAAKPGHADIETYLKAKGSSLADKGVHYVQGWATMDVMAAGIEKALKDGEEPDGPNIKKALESLGSTETGGLIGAGSVEFTADSHRGSTGTGVYEVKAGQVTELAANVTPGA